MAKLEKDIEGACRKLAAQQGALLIKFTSPGMTGIPDRILLMPGAKLAFIEFKRPGGIVSARQKYVRGLLDKLGFAWHLVDTTLAFRAVLHGVRHDA